MSRGRLFSYLFLAFLPSIAAFSEGLKFSEKHEGTVFATPVGETLKVDIQGLAAKALYEQVSAARSSEKLVGRNLQGDIAEDIYRNRGIQCSKLRNQERYYCQVEVENGAIKGCEPSDSSAPHSSKNDHTKEPGEKQKRDVKN